MSNTNKVTNLNADLLDGYHVSSYNNKPYGTIPLLNSGGYMDVGRHFEFHYDNTTGSDYSTILACTGNYSNTVNLPSASGTLALTADNVASSSKWANARTITLTGSVTGSVSLDGSTDVTLNTTTNHTHTGSEVILTGYSHRDSYDTINETDTVNKAIAKLEGAISGLENLLASI